MRASEKTLFLESLVMGLRIAFTALSLLCVLAASARAAEGPGDLVNLLEANFDEHPEYLPLVERLNSTFQMLEMPEDGETWNTDSRAGALAPDQEGGSRYRAICTASLLGPDRVITAGHCLRSKSLHFGRNHILRRHIYQVDHGRLRRTGYEDVALSGATLSSKGDLRVIQLERSVPTPLFPQADPSFSYAEGTDFFAMGFPNHQYAVPYLAVGCRIRNQNGMAVAITREYGGASCPIAGGMSGGPQFLASHQGSQIGINSLAGGSSSPQATVSPRLVAPLPAQVPASVDTDGSAQKTAVSTQQDLGAKIYTGRRPAF